MSPARLAALGAFVVGGVLLFSVGLFMIGERRMLFADTFEVFTTFSDIASLESGAQVRVAGMDAGEVEAIHVPSSPSGKFRIRMRVHRDLHPLVRLDSVASIQTDGLVGNKFVQIEAGSESAGMVPDGGTIPGREPFDFTDVLERMSQTVDNVNATIVDLRREITDALTALTEAARSARTLVEDVGRDAEVILGATEAITSDLKLVVARVREGQGTVGQLLTDDTLYKRAAGIATELEATASNVRKATERATTALEEFRAGGDGAVQKIVVDLQQTLASARDAMTDLSEATEALKRNFFLRGFFNRRGYYDLDEITVQQYREGALESGDRRALRLWIHADLLFERAPDGSLRLTDGGQARLDSAMSQFVQYAGSSPLVVEGYAPGPTADERFLLSRERARVVSEYVIRKFELDPNYVTTMPMGTEARESPSGDTWDGIALALFVPRASG